MLKQPPTEHRTEIVRHKIHSPGLHGIFMMESSDVLLERRTELSKLEDGEGLKFPYDDGKVYVQLIATATLNMTSLSMGPRRATLWTVATSSDNGEE